MTTLTALPSAAKPSRFLDWWLRELETLWPRRHTRSRRGAGPVLLWDEAAPQLLRSERRGRKPVSVGGAAELAAYKGPVSALRFPVDAGLRQRVLLPRAAEPDLERVIEFEMDRLTPFPADQVLYGFEQLRTAAGGAKIEVDLAVLPKGRAERALGRLRDLGITPEQLELAGPAASDRCLALHPRRSHVGGAKAKRHRFKLALAAYLLLTAAILGWLGWLIASEHAGSLALSKRIDAAEAANTEIADLRRDIAALAAVNGRLDEERRQRPSAAVLLEALSRLLPDEVWLAEFSLDDRQVRLSGFAPDPAALIPILTGSPHLRDIGFAAPSVRDPSSGRVRFAISGEARPLRTIEP